MSEFTDLAAEIARDTGIELEAAERLAWEQMPELLNDVMSDARYIPRRVVLLDQLLTARELMDLTER